MIYKHSLDFAITTYCQAKCRSCMRTNERTGETASWLKPAHMTYEDFDLMLNNSRDVTLHKLEFCGELGDPMMHPDISRFVDRGFKQATKININTNGGLRQPKWYKIHARVYDDLNIEWAIDGTDHNTNWMYREGVDFERAFTNMQTWFENGGHGNWHFLIFEWNVGHIAYAAKMAKENDIPICFKINHREFGKIRDDQIKEVQDALEEANQYVEM